MAQRYEKSNWAIHLLSAWEYSVLVSYLAALNNIQMLHGYRLRLSLYSGLSWKLIDGRAYVEKPKFGDKIALGLFTGAPIANASDIRMITIDDAAMFGASEKPDYILGV